MTVTTITSSPPQIKQYFNRKLLSSIGYKLYKEIFDDLLKRLLKKYSKCPGILKDIQKTIPLAEALYGWFETHQANTRTTGKKIKEVPPIPFNEIAMLNGRFGANHIRDVLLLFQYRTFSGKWEHNEIQKI